MLADCGDDFGAESRDTHRFVSHQQATGFRDRGEDRLLIPWPQSAEINDLGVDAVAAKLRGCFVRRVHGLRPADDTDIGSGAHHARTAEGHQMLALRHLAL